MRDGECHDELLGFGDILLVLAVFLQRVETYAGHIKFLGECHALVQLFVTL